MNSYANGVPARAANTHESSIVRFMRARPLFAYFALAYGLLWVWLIPMYLIWHQQVLGPWLILGPSLAGVIMAGVMEGRAGIVRLLKRVLVWRVGVGWYLLAVLITPAVYLLSVMLMPGGAAAIRAPASSFLPSFLAVFGQAFFSALLVEEFGWRGFALPRLQERYGPLLGTLILGLLWGFWHLPIRLFQPGDMQGGGFAGPFLLYVVETAASTFVFTWLFNHTRGSILLALVLHASVNATGGTFFTLFPALFPEPVIPVALEIGEIVFAVLLVLATRSRLGYDKYRLDVGVYG